ncbi:MAG: hypothetical protein ACFFKA_07340 [Candidatus Thorarchaeota archaeon]
MTKNVYCDKCGAIMKETGCESTFGIKANLFKCSRCAYQYETGLRYNPYIQDYVNTIDIFNILFNLPCFNLIYGIKQMNF